MVDRDGCIMHRAEEPTRTSDDINQDLARLRGTVSTLLSRCNGLPLGIGVAAASPVDSASGTMINPPNMPGWQRFHIKEWLEEEFHLPARVGNDANLAALAEYVYGIGEGVSDLIYVTISTGIGGGIISGGKLIDGPDGLGGEIGHMVIDRNGPRCNCGAYGCLESFASGTAIARVATERIAQGEASRLDNMSGKNPELVTAEMVAEAVAEGDELATQIMREAARCLGLGLSSLINIFSPRLIILGGGVTHSLYLMLPVLYLTIRRQAEVYLQRPVSVVPAALGDDVGLLGAAAPFFLEQM